MRADRAGKLVYDFLIYIYMLNQVKRTAISLHYIREKFRIQLYTRQMKFKCLLQAFNDEVAAMMAELLLQKKSKVVQEKYKKLQDLD